MSRSSEADGRESLAAAGAEEHLDIGVSAYQTGIVRTTVTLDDDVYQAAMHLSRSSGERLGKVLSGLARRGLVPRPAPPKRSSRRFPTFEVPPGAPVIPASRIERVIDEEGIF
jgi:hypothetical protein